MAGGEKTAENFISGILRGDLLALSDFLGSGYVLLVCAILVFVLIAAVVVSLIVNDNKSPKTAQENPASDSYPLRKKKEERVGEEETRFYKLNEIDGKREEYAKRRYDESVTLKSFCESFRNYAASRLKLYYSLSDIRKFVAGLGVTHLLILQGISGTGKTSLAYALGEFLGNKSTVIPVQPMWKERTDMIGYYNEFTGRFNETTLLEKMYEANYSKDIYITVLDEMNIARVEYYFAEFLSLMELPDAEERYLDVVTDKREKDPKGLKEGRIKLPKNMWFIGTANNDDSTFAISDKVYDRAMMLNLDEKSEVFEGRRSSEVRLSYERLEELVKDAKEEYGLTKRNERRLEELDEYLRENFRITFGNRVMKQIRTYIPIYVSCGGEEVEALDDILSKKVMRKLETQNPIYVKNEAEGLCEKLDEVFGEDKMKHCKAFIRRLEKNA